MFRQMIERDGQGRNDHHLAARKEDKVDTLLSGREMLKLYANQPIVREKG